MSVRPHRSRSSAGCTWPWPVSKPMMATPSGASGCSTSHSCPRKRLPESQWKVVRARGASAAFAVMPGVMRHWPTSTSRASSASGTVVSVLDALAGYPMATGTLEYPATFDIWTRRVLPSSTVKRGQRRAISSNITLLSNRARAAPRHAWIPKPKPSAWLAGSTDVEAVRVVVRAFVPGGRAGQEQHRVSGGDRDSLPRGRSHGEAALVLRRRPVPQHLLDGAGDRLRIVHDLRPLVAVTAEQYERVPDELGDGLGPRPTEQSGEAGDLGVFEAG